MSRRLLSVLLLPALLAPSGCSRTDDGTVIIPQALDMRRLWEKSPPGRTDPRRPLEVYPVAPQVQPQFVPPAEPTASRRKRVAKRASAAAEPSASPAKPLVCANAAEQGGRVHVVCR
jgi:hypothetical protein